MKHNHLHMEITIFNFKRGKINLMEWSRENYCNHTHFIQREKLHIYKKQSGTITEGLIIIIKNLFRG